MKHLFTYAMLLLSFLSFAQSGVDCSTAITQNPKPDCTPETYPLGAGQQELWLNVHAIHNDTSNVVLTWSNTTTQIVQAKVYRVDGGCGSLTLIKDIDVLASGLQFIEFVTMDPDEYMVSLIRDSSDISESHISICVEKNYFQLGLCWNSNNSSGVTDYFDTGGYPYWDGTVGYIAPDSTPIDGYGIHIQLCIGDTLCVHGVVENAANNYTPDCADLSYPDDIWWFVPGTDYASNLPAGEDFVYYPTTTNQLCMVYDTVGIFPVYYLDDTTGADPYNTWINIPTGFFVEVDDTAAFEPTMYYNDTICGQLGTLQNEAYFFFSDFYPAPPGISGETQLFNPFLRIYIDGQYASSGQYPNSFLYDPYGTVNLLGSSELLDSLNSIVDTYGTHSFTVEIVPQGNCRSPQSFTYYFEVLEPYVFDYTINCNEVVINNIGCQPIPESGANYSVNWGDGYNDNVTGTNTVSHFFDTPGTYDIIVQGASSGEYETITVTIQSVPTNNIGIHGETNVCCTSALEYSASPGYLTYNWTIAGGTIVGTLVNEVTVDWDTPFTGGQLTVTCTDFYGCTSTGTIYVDTCDQTPGDGPEIVGPDMKCCTTANVYSISGNYSDFNWTVTDGVIVADNGNSITVDWNSQDYNSTITVTMTDENCQEVTSTFVVEACCKVLLSSNGPTFYDPNFNTDHCAPTLISTIISSLGQASYTSGGAILINNDLIIDQDFEFNSCPFMFVREGFKIYVMPGIRFTLNNDCVIRPACDKPWLGIYADDPDASITINNSNLIGAETALHCENDAKYGIDNAGLFNNRIGIQLTNYFNISFNSIDNSDIGTNPSEINVFGSRPTHGMLIDNVTQLTVGEDNMFFDMDFGIHVTNSNVTCHSNTFNDFTPNLGSFNDGIAVYGNTTKGSAGNLLIVGSNNATKNFFDNCNIGMFVQNRMGLTAYNNKLTNITFGGVIARKSVVTFLDIRFNDIKLTPGFALGVYLWGMTNVTATVHNNKVNLTNISGVGAFVAGLAFDQATTGNINSVSVKNNNVRQCAYGVYANQTPGIDIADNVIQYFNNGIYSGTVYGVYAAGCTEANIESNKVTRLIGQPSNGNPDETLIGIHAENSPEVHIFDNTVNKFGKGIQARGNNANSEMFCNKLNRNFNGIYLLNADVGDQGGNIGGTFYDQDNKWTQNVDRRINGGAQTTNTWYYRSGTNYSPFPNLVTPNPPTFILNNSASSMCPSGGGGIIHRPRSQERGRKFNPIVYDQKNYITYDTTMKYLDKLYAMETFTRDTTWLTVGDSSDVTYHQYFTTESAGNLGKLCAISDAYKNENYTSLSVNNTALNTSTCNYTRGIKDVNEIYLSTWANDAFDFDPAQLARLEELACSDPMDNGVAVYSARTLLGWHYQCNNGYIKSATNYMITEAAASLDQQVSFVVYPNPSEAEVYLAYELGDYTAADLVVYDIFGKMVMNVRLSSETMAIQLPAETLNSGMYLYTVSAGGKIIANGKFVRK